VPSWWGNALLNVTDSVGTKNKFRFTGEALDPGTGLYYLRARYYDPIIGRFFVRDSFGTRAATPRAAMSYNYALNSPLLLRDPSGHTPETSTPTVTPLDLTLAVSGSTVAIPFVIQLPTASSLKSSRPITFSSPQYIPPPNAGSTAVLGSPNGDYPLGISDAASILKAITSLSGTAEGIMSEIAINPFLGGPVGAAAYGTFSVGVQTIFWLQDQSTMLLPQKQQ